MSNDVPMRGRNEQLLTRPQNLRSPRGEPSQQAGVEGSSAVTAHNPSLLRRALQRTTGVLRRLATDRPLLIGEVVIVLVLLKVYDLIRGQAEVRRGAAMHHGEQLMNLEGNLHIQFEPAINRWVTNHHALSMVASYWYQYAHISVTITMLAWCWWCRPANYRSARNSLVLINAAALAVFFLFPVAPPRLLPGYGFVDAVANAGFGTTHGGPVTADQYGALPSLHIGWAVWTALVGYRLVKSRALSWVWLCYPLITLAVIVATGNHYILDAVAGGALALVAQKITHVQRLPKAERRLAEQRRNRDEAEDEELDQLAG